MSPTATTAPIIGLTYSSAEFDQFQLWRQMFRGVVAAGGVPVAIDARVPHPDIADHVRRVDGLILSGGGDVAAERYGADPDDPLLRGVNPTRDQVELAALAAAQEAGLPVLAICRGAQLVNASLGGTLYVDLPRDHGSALVHRNTDESLDRPLHDVEVVPGSTLAKWTGGGRLAVNSQHHQAIRTLAPGLTPTAHAPDGLIEAYEQTDTRLVAVQWHPEVLWSVERHALDLLTAFCSTSGCLTG